VSDLVFRPVAGWIVAVLLPLGVSPVVVVCANGLAGLAGAVAIARGDLVAGALLLQLHMLLDNADGQLARASGRSTALGRYLDTEVDLVVNAAVFAALGYVTSAPVLAAAGFLALTLVLSVEFYEDVLYRRVRGEHVVTQPDATGEGTVARGLAWIYAIVFAPQDRAVQRFSEWRLERVLHGVTDAELRARATRAYYDGMTATVLANLGLSTQLAVLGVCLVLGAPAVYLWLILGTCLLLPLLQVRREVRARRVVHG
jgi:phosphatidylglycerophosphate synthase